MKTREQIIEYLAEQAEEQCNLLAAKFRAIADGYDDEGEEETERLCGFGEAMDNRPAMIFSDPYAGARQRTVICVDAILELAKIINGEVRVEATKKRDTKAAGA